MAVFLGNSDINELSDKLVKELVKCSNMYTIIREFDNNSNKEWYTLELKNLKSNRDSAYKVAILSNEDCNWQSYKLLRNKYSKCLNYSKCNFIKRKLIDKKDDSKGMWRILKDLVKGNNVQCPDDIDFGGVCINTLFLIHFLSAV